MYPNTECPGKKGKSTNCNYSCVMTALSGFRVFKQDKHAALHKDDLQGQTEPAEMESENNTKKAFAFEMCVLLDLCNNKNKLVKKNLKKRLEVLPHLIFNLHPRA